MSPLLIVLSFAAMVAALSAWLIKRANVAVIAAALVALVVPYVMLLYVGHRVVGIGLWHLLGAAAGSALLVVVLKRTFRRSG